MLLDIHDKISSNDGWTIHELSFAADKMNILEGLFFQGNGNIGVRGSYEEPYVQQERLTVIAGLFNKPEFETSGLPNLPDITEITIYIDGERLDFEKGPLVNYDRTLVKGKNDASIDDLQVIKQADIVALLHLFPEYFDKKTALGCGTITNQFAVMFLH